MALTEAQKAQSAATRQAAREENSQAKLDFLKNNNGCACGCGRAVGTPIFKIITETGAIYNPDDPFDGPPIKELYRLRIEHFEWDHIPGLVKVAPVSRLVSQGRRKAAKLEREKCQLLYVGCHRDITFRRDENAPKDKKKMSR